MDNNNNWPLVWNVKVELIDPATKEIVDARQSHNYVTNLGKTFFTRAISPATTSGTPNPYTGWQAGLISGISVGTSAANAGDVSLSGLASEVASSKQIIHELSYPSSGVVTYKTTYGTGSANGTLQEAGLWGGYHGQDSMVARNTFASITKSSAFELAVSWTLTFS